jgi:hypothetical protein
MPSGAHGKRWRFVQETHLLALMGRKSALTYSSAKKSEKLYLFMGRADKKT